VNLLEHCRQTCVRDGAHGRNYPKHSRMANRRRPICMAPICPARIASGRKVCFTRILAPSLSLLHVRTIESTQLLSLRTQLQPSSALLRPCVSYRILVFSRAKHNRITITLILPLQFVATAMEIQIFYYNGKYLLFPILPHEDTQWLVLGSST
jgi:hypothetical protein